MVTTAPLRPEPTESVRLRDELLPQCVEAVRLCLEGGSPLDLYRLQFEGIEQVTRFLDVNQADVEDPFDRSRLAHLHGEAVGFVRRHFGYRIPMEVARPERTEDLFLLAGGDTVSKTQVVSCVVLKLMHVINHLEARSLLHRTAISEAELEHEVERRMMGTASRMMAEGVPVTSFHANRKSRDSMITKLVVKRESTAAEILDRVRCRVVTREREDIVPVLAWLLRRVLPFNHVLAGQTINNLVDLDDWLGAHPSLRTLATMLHPPAGPSASAINLHSADSYRTVNFVVEMPVRLDRMPSQQLRTFDPATGRVVYVQADLLLLDRASAETAILTAPMDRHWLRGAIAPSVDLYRASRGGPRARRPSYH